MTYTNDDGQAGGKVSRSADIFSGSSQIQITAGMGDVLYMTRQEFVLRLKDAREREGKEVAEAIKEIDLAPEGLRHLKIYEFLDGGEIDAILVDRYGQVDKTGQPESN